MVARYKGLPDVDYDAQEVFENSDVDENEPEGEDDTTTNPQIIHDGVDRNEAKIRFNNEIVVDNAADFLGNISLRKFIGYEVKRVDETRQQKLARIEQELRDLARETPQQNDKEIDTLVSLLEGLQQGDKSDHMNMYGTKVKSLFALISKDLSGLIVSRDSTTPTMGSSGTDTAMVLELEAKVEALEAKIGPEFFANNDSTTLHNAIEELSRKTHIIHNPEYAIDVVKRKIDNIKKENDILEAQTKVLDVIKGSSILGRLAGPVDSGAVSLSEAERLQLQQLHTRIPDFDAVNTTVPHIIERLKTLQRVHIDTTNCVNFVGEFDLLVSDMKADMVKWDESINKCVENLDAYEANFAANQEAILKQIDDLGKKVLTMH